LTEKRFTPPADLDPGDYLSGAFGVAVYDDIKPCTIRIRAYGDGPKYLRTLPLHDSQQEIETTVDYADFEYRVAPTYEFYRAVLAQHIDIEVLSPIAVRNETERIIDEMNLLYSRHKRRMIFLDFDGVLRSNNSLNGILALAFFSNLVSRMSCRSVAVILLSLRSYSVIRLRLSA